MVKVLSKEQQTAISKHQRLEKVKDAKSSLTGAKNILVLKSVLVSHFALKSTQSCSLEFQLQMLPTAHYLDSSIDQQFMPINLCPKVL